MRVKTVLFDLDGTLLPMDQDVFIESYFRRLAVKLAPRGYEPKALIKGVMAGTAAMVRNDGSQTNEEAFWTTFAGIFGEQVREDMPAFEAFYQKEFQAVAGDCGFAPQAAETVKWLREKGFQLALATNPLFPAVATESRIRWAGLQKEDFLLYTTYENSRYCKPNLAYYREILDTLHLRAEECLMVGNDVEEDMVAQSLGMQVFLLTDCLINKKEKDISVYPHGSFEQLLRFIEEEIV